jgi:L-ascorbate metabolism protein UlaG (beta-lactamase superfamily)
MPISPIKPRHLVEHAHLDGKQAIQAFLDLNAQQFIPMHWGTFQFGIEQYEEPITLLKESWETHKEHMGEKTLSVLTFGQPQKLFCKVKEKPQQVPGL